MKLFVSILLILLSSSMMNSQELEIDDDTEELELDTPDPSDQIYMIAERMPVFPGECEKIAEASEQASCSESAVIMFLQKNAIYPEISRENGERGTVYLEFVINKSGEIEQIQVLKGASSALDQAAINAVKKLPKMIPAKQRGEAVNIKYVVPVRFAIG